MNLTSKLPLTDDITRIIANDSLNINDYQQSRRKTNRRNNQRKNIGKIIWNNVKYFLFFLFFYFI